MSDGPKTPSRPTIKRLFALSGNRCAFPECPTPLVERQTGSIVGEVCHIKGEKPTAPRHDDAQDNHARHGFDNLILLCNVHHKVIDDKPTDYPVERLINMKEEHESHQGGKNIVNDGTSEAFASAMMHSIGDHNEGVQAVNVSGGQVANTIINNIGTKPAIVLTSLAAIAAIGASIQLYGPAGDEGSVVFGQIEIVTRDCAWEPISRPIQVVAPFRNVAGKYWNLGGPPIGSPPQREWTMGSHHLWPLREAGKNDNLDVDPIFDVTLVNKGPSTIVVSRIGIRPVAAWTSPKGPPFSGRIVDFDSYSLEVDGFEPGKDQYLVLEEPVRLIPNDPYRLKLRLSGYCRHAPRNETVIQLVVEADQKIIASDDIYLGLHTVLQADLFETEGGS